MGLEQLAELRPLSSLVILSIPYKIWELRWLCYILIVFIINVLTFENSFNFTTVFSSFFVVYFYRNNVTVNWSYICDIIMNMKNKICKITLTIFL